MTEPKRRAASEYPPYRPTADRLADLEQNVAHLQTWQGIGEQRDAALQNRIAALEIENHRLSGLVEEVLAALERLGVPRHPQ